MALLERIKGPADVKALTSAELAILAEEIRREIIEVTSKNGGHIGPNLGVVELTLALHRVFDTPKDRFVMDVAHQGYVHKLLTGRAGPRFKKIRQGGGLSGFLMREESEHDCYGAGHAGTALSAALGMAAARDLNGTNEHVVALLGDAALTCGITMEALNNVATSTKRLIVVLNDNEWSIAKNVGAISTYLNELITKPWYNRFHHDLESFLKKTPGGDSLRELGARAKKEAKDFIVPSSLFEKFNLRYLGPIDGHDLKGQGLRCRDQEPGEIPRHQPVRHHHRPVRADETRDAAELAGRVRQDARAICEGRPENRRHHRGDALGHEFVAPGQGGAQAIFRRGHRRGTRGALCRGPGHERPAPRVRDLLDLPPARL
jgi:transketolase N-terminal domain/subunit